MGEKDTVRCLERLLRETVRKIPPGVLPTYFAAVQEMDGLEMGGQAYLVPGWPSEIERR